MKFLIGLVLLLLGGSAVAQPVPPTGCTTTTCTGSALPVGYLSVVGNQFQNSPGSNVRPACTVFRGLPTDNLSPIRNAGFNCILIGWRDAYVGAVQTTWSPTDLSGMTLSNGNLTATGPVSGVGGVRATTSKSSGKYCWQTTTTTIGLDTGIGVANATFNLTTGLSIDANGEGFYAGKAAPNSQIAFFNSGLLTQGPNPSAPGDAITNCADFDAKLVWHTDTRMRTDAGAGAWNNSGTCNPTVAGCGLSFAAMTGPFFPVYSDRAANSVVLNTAGPYAVSLPSGYSFWDQLPSTPAGCNSPTQIDGCVAAAQSAGLTVIFNHLGNEVPAVGSACIGRQQNGLWFDQGGSSGNDDGCGNGHNWTYAGFKQNTVSLLGRYNGNPTVIGYELHNEPMVQGVFTGAGGGGGTGPFTISGGNIFNPNGNLWKAYGINILDNDMVNVPVATFRAVFPKANFVRLAVGGDNCGWQCQSVSNATLIAWVKSYTAQGIVVAIESHFTGQIAANTIPGGASGEFNWYRALAQDSAVVSDRLIWFMSGNELCNPGLTAEHQNVYNAVRGAGKTDPIILTMACGNPISSGGQPDGPASAYNTMTKIAFDWHYYNWVTNGSTDQNVANNTFDNIITSTTNYTTSADGLIPVIAGEDGFNDYICSSNGPTGGVCGSVQTVTAAQQRGPVTGDGYAIWLWKYTVCCSAQTDLVNEPANTLTSLGQIVFNNMAVNGTGPFVAGGTGNPPVNWGGGGDTDIRLACSDVGAAVNAVNPGVILFCPGPLNNGTTLLSGAAKP